MQRNEASGLILILGAHPFLPACKPAFACKLGLLTNRLLRETHG